MIVFSLTHRPSYSAFTKKRSENTIAVRKNASKGQKCLSTLIVRSAAGEGLKSDDNTGYEEVPLKGTLLLLKRLNNIFFLQLNNRLPSVFIFFLKYFPSFTFTKGKLPFVCIPENQRSPKQR